MPVISLPSLPAPNSVDILFVTYGGGHVRMVLPVAKALQDAGHSVSIFALTTAIEPTQKSGLPWFSYASLPQAKSHDVQSHGNRLTEGFPKDGPVPFVETVAYHGINYCNMEKEYGAQEAAIRYEKDGRAQFYPIHTMKEILTELRPKVVVATNSPRSEMAAIRAANMLDIPSLCMVDLFALQEQAWIKDPNYATEICVINTEVRDMLISKGRPAEDIIITGNPAFDELQDPKTISAGQIMRKERSWGEAGRITLLYASSPEPLINPHSGQPTDPAYLKLPLQLEQKLIDLVSSDPDLELVIRRHPSQPQNVALQQKVWQSTMEDNIDTLLHAVDIVVVTSSTVGFQAYIAGRPVLSVECSSISQDMPYGAYGISHAVKSLEEISTALEEIIEGLYELNADIDEPKALATTKVSERIRQYISLNL